MPNPDYISFFEETEKTRDLIDRLAALGVEDHIIDSVYSASMDRIKNLFPDLFPKPAQKIRFPDGETITSFFMPAGSKYTAKVNQYVTVNAKESNVQ